MSEQHVASPELEQLANEVGDFICFWGFKKIHGRLWTHLFLSREALDAGQLMCRLKVSKALISLSINDLLRFEVIRESSKSARGTQTYIANPDVLEVILNVLRRRERKMLVDTQSRFRALADLPAQRLEEARIAPERLQTLGKLIQHADQAFTALLELTAVDFSCWTSALGLTSSNNA